MHWNAVVAAHFVTMMTKRVRFDAVLARFVTPAFVCLCHHVVTKRAERFTRCTFCHPFASNTIICLSSFLDVCVCARLFVYVCARPRGRVWGGGGGASVRVYCVVLCLIIPASVSVKLKFRIPLNRLKGYSLPVFLCQCRIWLDIYIERERPIVWFDRVL